MSDYRRGFGFVDHLQVVTTNNYNIVTCRMLRVTNNYGIRRMIGFINTSVTLSLLISINYKQYTAIVVDLYFIQLAIAHALGFPVSTSRLPATAFSS
jgi:hypothetical protein